MPTKAQLYGRQWRKARAYHLRQHPYCALCDQLGITQLADVVDHIVPHRGDPVLFWDHTNWQSLCTPCHNGAKASLEATGKLRGVSTDGLPIDPNHHWNRS